MELMDLRQFVDKTVVLHMMDGETAKVRVDFLDQEYEDIIVKVLETSHPEHYRDSSPPTPSQRQILHPPNWLSDAFLASPQHGNRLISLLIEFRDTI